MRVARPLAGGLVCVLAVASAGCRLSRVSQAELPDAPIAIHYRTQEEARLHAEQRDAHRPAGGKRRPGVSANAGIAHTDDLEAYLGGLFGGAPEAVRSRSGRLALLDPRTGGVEVVEAALRGSIPLAWSRDRQRLLFAQPGAADVQLWELWRAQGTVRPVTHGPLAHTQGCYGPDGRVVVVVVDARVEAPRSWIASSAEGGREPFTPISPGPRDHSPACAGDGDSVAYVSETEQGRGEVWIARIFSDSAPRMLASGRDPRFSPDGEWIVFSAPVQRLWRLWRMRADGTARAPLGRGVREESHPAISPDGRYVAYVAAEAEPRRHLYLRRFDGSGDRILFANGDGEYPVW